MVVEGQVCCRCKRLTTYRKKIAQQYPNYHCRPVEAFGAKIPKLLIVGLAPGLHGANATGRPFTGDASGKILFETLYKFGYASQLISQAVDDMQLHQCRITNAVKCLPPENKPSGSEVNTCNTYLQQEISELKRGAIILALGGIAHKAVLKACGLRLNSCQFGHDKLHKLDNGLRLIDSYHCSRYNIQTGRLNAEMFERVFHRISTIGS